MTRSDNSMEKLMAEAERLGKEQEKIDERNRKRRAKGRKPLPDPQERKDLEVSRRRHRTADSTTVDAADAMKLFEIRKAAMGDAESGVDDPDDDVETADVKTPDFHMVKPADSDPETDRALRDAEAARRVQDLKGGRIDHQGNWSEEGQKLEGGDKTTLTGNAEAHAIWAKAFKISDADEHPQPVDSSKETVAKASVTTLQDLDSGSITRFKKDLYQRLSVSFEALERSLSDLQGRVSEIVTASTPKETPEGDPQAGSEAFKALLERKTPVVFDVGGTQMTFDAICVFHASPCITVVSRIGSAKITPKPGARLTLSYEMDGQAYTNDPVTYLGTRFDLPMFGLSFVGFIRDREADSLDANV